MPDGAGRHSEAYDPKAVTHEVRTKLLTMRSCEDRTAKSGSPLPVIASLYSEPQRGPGPASMSADLAAIVPSGGASIRRLPDGEVGGIPSRLHRWAGGW
jgi:hypothetical protein